MNLGTELNLGDLISTIALIIAGIGLFLNLWQLRKDSIRKRAEFIIEYFNQYLSDVDAVDMFYKIEYGDFKYRPQSFHGSMLERKLDKLLNYFERISMLYEMGVITLNDLKIVKYEFIRISEDKSVQRYLDMVNSWEEEEGIRGGSYSSFLRVSSLLKKRENTAGQISKFLSKFFRNK